MIHKIVTIIAILTAQIYFGVLVFHKSKTYSMTPLPIPMMDDIYGYKGKK